mmetsp:Transcript_52080/g.118703  ORF Transcript_52080/g.118703 Transcript_52080/m.118703 type:complete len:136 (+) Transcript_52080:1045-1452(+)
MYLNQTAFRLPRGLGLGGQMQDDLSFRLFLPEEGFENCTSRGSCSTYEAGTLSLEAERAVAEGAPPTFELRAAEVWGVGGNAALGRAAEAQAAAREIEAANIRRARKVDKAAFFDSAFDREMFLGKTFGQSGDGR